MLYLFAFEHVHKLSMYGNGKHVNLDMVCRIRGMVLLYAVIICSEGPFLASWLGFTNDELNMNLSCKILEFQDSESTS